VRPMQSAGERLASRQTSALRQPCPHCDSERFRIELGLPQDFYAKELVRAFAYGGMRDLILA